jgi:hypothetical protein
MIARRGRHNAPLLPSMVLLQIISRIPILAPVRNPFDCAAPDAFLSAQGASRTVAMIEMVTGFFGFISASIFLAHAYEGYRSRPVLQKQGFRKI